MTKVTGISTDVSPAANGPDAWRTRWYKDGSQPSVNDRQTKETAMVRPRTKLVKARKARRCSKCGSALNNQQKRCKKCHATQALP